MPVARTPAALAIHLSIGQVYAFSVFKIPMTTLLGITASTPGDWQQGTIAHLFQVAIAFLGVSAAVFGAWLERVGPRERCSPPRSASPAGSVGAWVSGFTSSGSCMLGYGVLGGIGLGLGYISPVSTLIKWFPDRPGMATGLAIMGFGGGALLGVAAVGRSSWPTSSRRHDGCRRDVARAWASIYFVFMMFGVFTVRLPAPGWAPRGLRRRTTGEPNDNDRQRDRQQSIQTPQFWLLWMMLCVNVTAGIGILGAGIADDPGDVRACGNADAGGFVGLLSVANMGGRFFWSSLGLYRAKATYATFFLLGPISMRRSHTPGRIHSVPLFVTVLRVDPHDVRRRVRDDPGISPRYVRHDPGRSDSRTPADGVVHGRHSGSLSWSTESVNIRSITE